MKRFFTPSIIKFTILIGFLSFCVSNINAQAVRDGDWDYFRFGHGFKGNRDLHEVFGGWHVELGACFTQHEPYDDDLEMRGFYKLQYSNFNSLPITLEGSMIAWGTHQSLGAGLGSSYCLYENLAFNYGIGIQRNWRNKNSAEGTTNLYYTLGVTYMFSEYYEELGGVRYSYTHSFGNFQNPVQGHYVSFLCGTKLTKYALLLSILYILPMMDSVLGKP